MERNKRPVELQAAIDADPERSHRGEATLSFETNADTILELDWLVADHPAEFLRLLTGKRLHPLSLDSVFSYLFLGIDQPRIARVLCLTQSQVSAHMRRAWGELKQSEQRTVERRRARKRFPARYLEHRSDPTCVGEFRVSMQDAEHVLSARSHVRTPTNDMDMCPM